MSGENDKPPVSSSAIADAIRAKRDGFQREERDWAAIADELIHEIEAFDLDAAEQQKVFPNIVPGGVRHHTPSAPVVPEPTLPRKSAFGGSALLGELRAKALERQQQLHQELAARTAASEAIDRGLRKVFGYLL